MAEPQFVDEAQFEERLGECDAPMDADIIAGPLPQLGDERDKVAVGDAGVGPGRFRRRRGHDEFLAPLMKLANGSMSLFGQYTAHSS